MEEYYQNNRQKRADFITGLIINLVVGVIAGVIYLGSYLLLTGLDVTIRRIIMGVITAVIVSLVAIYEVWKIRKHLKQRRYIAIGMIVGLIIPLLAVGTCSPLVFDVNMT